MGLCQSRGHGHPYIIMWDCMCVFVCVCAFIIYVYQEEKAGEKVGEAKEVKLYGQIPPVEKMDASLSTLINCE